MYQMTLGGMLFKGGYQGFDPWILWGVFGGFGREKLVGFHGVKYHGCDRNFPGRHGFYREKM